jgi:4-amino-4-deoxy-L-arabinose transferase-like glycosyltransferase
VTETTTPIVENTQTSTAARIGWAVLIVATLYVCYFSHLGAIGFVGPDEPRYAWIARDMAETGDWITPRLYGKPWFEKPPLFYWGAALSFRLFGVSEAAARSPSAVSALLATLALAWLALRLYGAETARWLLLLLPTTVGMIGFSHAAATDMPFSGMLTVAMVYAAVVLGVIRDENTPILPRTPWLGLLLFGFFLGLAVLAKGPAAIILASGAVFFWALFTKRWRDGFRLFHPVALASFCLTALPWYILCAERNPDFFRIFIIEHNFKRYLTPEFQHIQPFWFYVPVILVALLPWMALLPALISDLRKNSGEHFWGGGRELLILCWSVFPIAFFSLSKSKLPGYVLPSIPPLILMLARSVSVRLQKAEKTFRWIGIAGGLILLATAAALYVKIQSIPDDVDYYSPPGPFAVVVLGFGVIGVLACLMAIVRRVGPALVLCAITISASVVFSLTGDAASTLDRGISNRTAAFYVGPGIKLASVSSVFTYRLNRTQCYGLNFYLHRELQEWKPGGQDGGLALILTNHVGGQQLQKFGLTCLLQEQGTPITVCKVPTASGRPSP